MENKVLNQVASSLTNTSIISQVLNKLDGKDVTIIAVSVIAAGTLCYICNNGGCLEFSMGDKKVSLNKNKKTA